MNKTSWVQLPNQRKVDAEWFGNDEPSMKPGLTKDSFLQDALSANYKTGDVICLCRKDRTPPLQVAIVKRANRFHLARFPDTGAYHSPQCVFHERAIDVSGTRAYSEGVLRPLEEGGYQVVIGSKLGAALATAATQPSPQPSATGQGTKRSHITALGLLHLLWEHSGLNHFLPDQQIKSQVRWMTSVHRIRRAAAAIRVGNQSLAHHLLAFPPRSGPKDKEAAKAIFAGSNDHRIVVIGKLSALVEGSDKKEPQIRLAGSRDIHPSLWFNITGHRLAHLKKSFPFECAHLEPAADREHAIDVIAILVAKLSVSGGTARLYTDDIALMAVDQRMIPVASSYEARLAAHLAQQDREFLRPLRFDLREDEVLPDFELHDAHRLPYALEVYGRTDEAYAQRRREKDDYYAKHYPGRYWYWDAATEKSIPEIPAKEARP